MYSEILSISNFVYLLSALILLLSFILKKRQFETTGKVIFILAFAIEIAYFILRTLETFKKGYDYLPVTNAFDSFVFFTISVAFFQSILIKKSSTVLVMFSSLLISATLLFLSISGFNQHIEPLIPALKSNWLTAHVITAFLAYAAFAMNFLASSYVLYSSEKNIDRIVGAFSFSSLLSIILSVILLKMFHLDIYIIFIIFWLIVSLILFFAGVNLKPYTNKDWIEKPLIFGFILLTAGIITGSIWAKYAWGGYWSWDPKETWSLITWIVYLINLHFIIRHKPVKFLAYLGVLGFVCVLITYLGVNFILPGLHSYGSQ